MALTQPERVESLLLSAPGGSLIAEATPDLQAFSAAERSALARDDVERAVEANLASWVDGPHRDAGDVDPAVRDLVRQRVTEGIPDARRVDWADTAHLPSMERPDDFSALLRSWLAP